MKVTILYPNSESTRFLCSKLLETGYYKVVFYCPDSCDLDIAQNIICEMNILGQEQNKLRGIDDSFAVPTNPDLRDCDIVGK